MAARNAADYAARVGGVARDNPYRWAEQSVQASLRQAGAQGNYAYFIQADEDRGGLITVIVYWEYPTLFSGLCDLFGGGCPKNFSGSETAVWKREGW
jgi:hypothetical protein